MEDVKKSELIIKYAMLALKGYMENDDQESAFDCIAIIEQEREFVRWRKEKENGNKD